MNTTVQIRALITRLSRLDASETWEGDLNPVQLAAVEYLSQANRFSRAPSQVAEFMGTTRGTMSQTLKALTRKGYAKETRSEVDKRSIRYDLTESGQALAARTAGLSRAIASLPADRQDELSRALSQVLQASLAARGGRAFGICRDCVHHRKVGAGARCALLALPLAPEEGDQICHEQVAA